MKTLIVCCLLVIASIPAFAGTDKLVEVSDLNLVHLLNDFEVLAMKDDLRQAEFRIRIIRLKDHGECDETLQSCPKQALYIAIGAFREFPTEKLFTLPKAYGWEFVGWTAFPKGNTKNDFIAFEVQERRIPTTPEKGSWSKRNFEIRVNPWQGFIEETKKSQVLQ